MAYAHGSAESTEGASMERIVLADATFRQANDRIETAADEHSQDGDLVPFVCECADLNCREIVRMTLDEYRLMRSDPRLFVNLPGHHASAHGHAAVVAERDGHVVVEKLGAAGDLAAKLKGGDFLPAQKTTG